MELQIPYRICTKVRRKVAYGKMRAEIGKILRELCDWKQVEIVEAEVCPDHIHMLVKVPPKMSVSGFVGFLNRSIIAARYSLPSRVLI